MRHLPAGLQPPGASRLGPGRDPGCRGCRVVGRSLAVRHHIEVGPGPALRQPGPHLPDILRFGVPAIQVVLRDDTVAAQDPAHGRGPGPGADDPDRDALLNGTPDRREVAALALVVKVPAVVALPPLPQPADQVDALVEELGPAP